MSEKPAKRNLLEEIRSRNARMEGRYLHGISEMYDLEAMLRDRQDVAPAFSSLLLVGVASCVEVSVRESIKRLVDSGDPFLSRAERFTEGGRLKFDFALTKALSERAITFGELVAHSLPVSNLGHIASHFETLFRDSKPVKFEALLEGLKEFVEPTDEEIFDGVYDPALREPSPLLVDDVASLCSMVAELFELRHIVAHEANFQAVGSDQIHEFIGAVRLFVTALYELVEQTLNPNGSRNSFGESLQELHRAGEWSAKADAALGRLRVLSQQGHELNKEVFASIEEAQKAFDAYLQAELEMWEAWSGLISANGMRYQHAAVTGRLWEQRTVYLEWVEQCFGVQC